MKGVSRRDSAAPTNERFDSSFRGFALSVLLSIKRGSERTPSSLTLTDHQALKHSKIDLGHQSYPQRRVKDHNPGQKVFGPGLLFCYGFPANLALRPKHRILPEV
jgi:hypothetical protein